MTRWYPPKHAPAPASFNAEKVRQAIELATVLMAACAAPVVVHAASPDARGTAFFETKIRPLLMARCYECHSASSAKLGGKLSLDSRRGWQAGGEGGQVIVPGKPDESRLIKAVQWTDDEVHMPPKKQLPAQEIALLTEWVRRGAPDPRTGDHAVQAEKEGWESTYQKRRHWWSLRPLLRASPPAVKQSDWPREPLDRFILARLEQEGLRPASEAKPAVLLRRLTFALTGLPPEPEDVQRFLRASTPEAYESVVDSLLSSPRFGEHWARHWMDVVHYADTHGYEWDIPAKHAWRYRDYLVRAFNADLPFRQLVLEQLAGDLLSAPRIDRQTGINESLIGPMSLRLGERRHGDNSEFDGITQEAIDNVIDTVSKAYLATTVACAHCHDHKLDALAQRDYYAWAGIFMSSRWVSRSLNAVDPNVATIAEMRAIKRAIRSQLGNRWRKTVGANASAIAAALALPRPAGQSTARPNWDALASPSTVGLEEPAHLLQALAAGRRRGATIETVWADLAREYRNAQLARQEANRHAHLLADFTKGTVPAGWSIDGLGLRNGFAKNGEFAVTETGTTVVRHFLPAGLYSHLYSNRLAGAIRSPLWRRATVEATREETSAVEPPAEQFLAMQMVGGGFAAAHPVVDHALFPERATYLNLPFPTWIREHTRVTDAVKDRRIYFELATLELNNNYPARTGVMRGMPNERSWFGVTRIYAGSPPQDELSSFDSLFTAAPPKDWIAAADRIAEWLNGAVVRWQEDRALAGDVLLLNWMLSRNLLANEVQSSNEIAALVERYRTLERSVQADATVGSIADLHEARNERIGLRGSYSEMGDVVPRGNIRFLANWTRPTEGSRSGRLELAQCLASSENPLTARVYVNRVWSVLFGEGIVRTVDDFGHLGENPSHPELLDFLARRFIDEGWSTKRLVRSIVLSATWKQSGEASADALRKDPENRLLHHQPLRRLQAEELRDAVLAVSGRLESTCGGPAVDPFRHSEDAMKRLFAGPIDGNGRRSLYIKMTLMEPPKFLAEFNQPLPKLTTGHRDVTNVPNQALTLLNDPFVALEAHHWADRVVRDRLRTPRARLEHMLTRALGRPAQAAECDRFERFLRDDGLLRGIPEDKLLASVSLWQDVAHAIYNLKEFLYVR